jgi:hypothetical protein
MPPNSAGEISSKARLKSINFLVAGSPFWTQRLGYPQEGLPESLVATGSASPAILRQRYSSPSNCTAKNWPVCELALEILPTEWV